MDLSKILAKSNSESSNYYLVNHTKMVLNLAMYAVKNCFVNLTEKDYSELATECILHDIGKCCKSVQAYLSAKKTYINEDGIESNDKETNPIKHNVISWAFAKSNIENDHISRNVLYHHPNFCKDKTTDDILLHDEKLVDSEDIDTMYMFYSELSFYFENTFGIDTFELSESDNIYNINDEPLYTDKSHLLERSRGIRNLSRDKVYDECKCDILRAILIYSDRTVSSEKYDNSKILANDTEYLKFVINSTTMQGVHNVVDFREVYPGERTEKQYRCLDDFNTKNNLIIPAQAGFGKTLIGIIGGSMMNNNKVLWVTPKNTIAEGTYYSIIGELENANINNIKVGLFLSGEMKANSENNPELEQDDMDVLVTNIDSILNYSVKNNVAHLMFGLYNNTIIFDEYHEFVTDCPMFAEFTKLITSRVKYTKSKSLFLSATPYEFEAFPLGIEHCSNADELFINKDMNVHVRVKELSSFTEASNTMDDSIIICGSIKMSQDFKKSRKDAFLCHAIFTDEDKERNREFLYKTHGKHSVVKDRQLIIGTSIIGTGCDISAHELVDCNVSPDDTIQRGCGRIGRFNEAEYNNEVYYTLVILKNRNILKTIIDSTFTEELSNKWHDIIKQYDGQILTKGKIYELYTAFKRDNKAEYKKMYSRMLIESFGSLSDLTMKSSPKKSNDGAKYVSCSANHRGSERSAFVTAKKSDGSWCEPISISEYKLFDEFDESGTDEELFGRREYILNNKNFPEEGTLKSKKYRMKSKIDYTVDRCLIFARCSKTPIPLFDSIYDEEYGLIKKSKL